VRLLFKEGRIVGGEELLQNPVHAQFPQPSLALPAPVIVPSQVTDAKRGSCLQFNVQMRLANKRTTIKHLAQFQHNVS